jgi:[acyl-carrier-protein] S-malonyltransferase
MTLAYVLDGALFDVAGLGVGLYERFASVRRVYAEAAEWSGLEVDRLLRWELTGLPEHRQAGAIRQAAVVLGVCDLLAERGVRPDIVAGISMGGMIGACVAGAMDRRDLFTLLKHLRDAPEPTGPRQGMAALTVPAGTEVEEYLGGLPDGVHVAVDCGLTADGERHAIALSGHVAALVDLAGKLPAGALNVLPKMLLGAHSPLCRELKEYQDPFIEAIAFRDPVIPLCSCHEPKLLTTADEVRGMFLRNWVDKVSYPHIYANLMDQGADLAIMVGPGAADRFRGVLECPVVQIEEPDDLSLALTTLYELGLGGAPSPTAGSGAFR